MSALEARDLAIGYGGPPIARGIDLVLPAGSVTCLLGPNGAGKTTLFKTLLGLLPARAGQVALDGMDIRRLGRGEIARRMAYVPQAQDGTFISGAFISTVLDVALMGRTAHLRPFAAPGRRDVEIAMAALDTLGLASQAGRDAGRVSGGQRQLAFIARALAQQAHVIVMDEPTASLDLGNQILVLEQIRRLAAAGIAIVLSTHDPRHAFEIADRTAIIGSDATIQAGPTADVLTSDTLTRLYGVPLLVEQTPSGRISISHDR